jgi:hypothetical protein
MCFEKSEAQIAKLSKPLGSAVRRKVQLFLLLLLVAASTEAVMQASIDGERWLATYKTQLQQAKAVKRLQAVHARLKRAAQSEMAVYVKPGPVNRQPEGSVLAHTVKPEVTPVVFGRTVKPKLTPEQMLERFKLLCGDLPDEPKKDVLDHVAGEPRGPESVAEMTPLVPQIATETEAGDQLIPSNLYSPYASTGRTTASNPPMGGGGFPTYGGGSGGGRGGQTTQGGGGDAPTLPPAVAPEPSGVVLMLTGAAAIAGAMRRRWNV